MRAERRDPGPTFFQQHRQGIFGVWARDSREWWRQHYIAVHGTEPPPRWWIDNPRTKTGGQIAPGLMRAFGSFDKAVMDTYFRDMENRYRAESGIPERGEGWVSQSYLARLVQDALPGVDVFREASPTWLGQQRLDIYIPAMHLAIEYQGEQHFAAFDHWGGEEGLLGRQELDLRKRVRCEEAGVRLIEWMFDTPITAEAVHECLASAGVGL